MGRAVLGGLGLAVQALFIVSPLILNWLLGNQEGLWALREEITEAST